jgi:hypothetical protein
LFRGSAPETASDRCSVGSAGERVANRVDQRGEVA